MSARLRGDAVGSLAVVALVLGSIFLRSETPVADAASRGDVEATQLLIAQGADVNEAHGDGMTPLHWAAEHGAEEMTNLLLAAGANVLASTRIGHYTPLHLASRAGSAPVVHALLGAGSDARAITTTTGVEPIHLAAESGNPEVVRLLAEHGADVSAREAAWGHTPLIFAAAFDRPEVVRTLLALGADPSASGDVVDVALRSALDSEAQEAREVKLEALREEHAKGDPHWRPSPDQLREAIEAGREVQRSGRLAQDTGAAAGDDPSAGAEFAPPPATNVGWGGLTPLLHASRAGHASSVVALLEGGADVNQVSGSDRTSPMLIAAINGHFDLMTMLLEQGGDPNLQSADGATPLFAVINLRWASKSRTPQPRAHEFQEMTYLDAMEALLEAGADPNVRLERDLWYKGSGRSLSGATPFWRAAYGTDVNAMRLLVAYGADPHVPTKTSAPRQQPRNADTADEPTEPEVDPSGLPPVEGGGPAHFPLHAASGAGYGENYSEANVHYHAPEGWMPSMRYLVDELGADVNARDSNGYSAVHHAAARGDTAMIRFLVDRGADVTVLSRRGQTTADMANSPGQRLPVFPEAIALLERLGSHNNQKCQVC